MPRPTGSGGNPPLLEELLDELLLEEVELEEELEDELEEDDDELLLDEELPFAGTTTLISSEYRLSCPSVV
jgi:hypothetical protein